MAYVTSKTVPGKKGSRRKVFLAKWQEAGKKREKSFKMQRDARVFAAEMQNAHESRALSETKIRQLSVKPFDSVAKDFMDSLRKPTDGSDPRAEITIRCYQSLLDNHICKYSPHFEGPRTINSVSEADLKYISDGMYESGASYDRVSKAIALTKTILRYGICEKNRTTAVPNFSVVKPSSVKMAESIKRKNGVFTPDQLYTMLRAADALAEHKNSGTRKAWLFYRPMVYFLVETGTRIGEARTFPRSGFDPQAKLIKITQSATESGKLKSPKSVDGLRDIPLSTLLLKVMEPFLAAHSHELAFGTQRGTVRGLPNLYRRMWYPLIDYANKLANDPEVTRKNLGGEEPKQEISSSLRGMHEIQFGAFAKFQHPELIELPEKYRLVSVPRLGFHAVRHAYASRLISAGANLKQLQVWMGHHDPAFTLKVYGHLFSDDAEDVLVNMAF